MNWTRLDPRRYLPSVRSVVVVTAMLGVLAAAGLACAWFLFPALDVWLAWRFYSRWVNAVSNTTGLSHYLVTAGALCLFVPFYWAVSQIMYHPLDRPRRLKGLGVLLGLALIYNLGLYAMTRDAAFAFQDGKAGKYYAITPAGVRFFDRPGFDPKYGIRLEPVTVDNIRTLELLRTGESKPVDPGKVRWFNPLTGAAELWYTVDVPEAGSMYRFYDKPGWDARSGQKLEPVTHAVLNAWTTRMRAEEESKRERDRLIEIEKKKADEAAKAEKRRDLEEQTRANEAAAKRMRAEAELAQRRAEVERAKNPVVAYQNYPPERNVYWAGHAAVYTHHAIELLPSGYPAVRSGYDCTGPNTVVGAGSRDQATYQTCTDRQTGQKHQRLVR